MGSENASMPTKCMDHTPQPIETAPPASQRRAEGLRALFATREERFSAVYETKTATTMERRTSHGSYVPAKVLLHQKAGAPATFTLYRLCCIALECCPAARMPRGVVRSARLSTDRAVGCGDGP